ncbi:MAG: DUF58 domain-containing protein [Thiothrix sp.]|nr:MAG: DUF58 domain-containing protein [Thiothrix sp.]
MRAGDGLVYSSLQSLLRLQTQVRTLNLAKRHVRARQVGLHRSVFKGRGMDFAESRPYQPGDDIRTIDWRVTARSGKVHTKVFQEEREKPVLIWLDLRPSMFFATQGRFKSVVAAETASLLIWKTLSEGDRAGGVLQEASAHFEFKPSRSRSSVLGFMRSLSEATQQDPSTFSNNGEATLLQDSWRRLRRVTESGTQVFVISDFRQANPAALQQLAMIHRQASITLVMVRDPLEDQLPAQGVLRVTDGQRSLWVNLKQKVWRRDYHERQRQAQVSLQEFARKHRIPLIQLSTRDSTNERLLKLVRGMK